MRALFLAATFVGTIVIGGCSQKTARIETTISPDGSVFRRTTQQDDETLPESARTGWQRVELTDTNLVRAEGTFKDVPSIPPHFVQPSADGSTHGELVRDYERTDYGFFVEHYWTEELTDVVEPSAIPGAAKALTAFVADVCNSGLREFLGEEIDDGRLTQWIKSRGTEIVVEIALLNLFAHARGQSSFEILSPETIHGIGKRHGIEIDKNDPKTSIRRFLGRELPKRIRYADGRVIEKDRMESIVKLLSGETMDGKDNACNDAFRRAIENRFEGDDFPRLVGGLLTPLVGVYADRLFFPAGSFAFSFKFPGHVIETNGVIIDESQVDWKFHSDQAALFGYKMYCRSVERIDRVSDNVLGTGALTRRREMIELIRLADQDDMVRTELVGAAKGKSIAHLDEEVRKLLRAE